MKINKLNIHEIDEAPYNPRVNLKPGDPIYEKLKTSIQTFGYVEPIIVNKKTNHVVGGHQRLKVLKDLSHKTVDCVIIDIPIEKEKALNVALNKIVGQWDESKLAELLQEFEDFPDFDVTLTGFDEDEMSSLISRVLDSSISNGNDDEFESAQELIASLGSRVYFFGACDPSLGHRTGRGDYSAIVIVAYHRETKINYVIAADLARRRPDETIQRIIEYAKMYKIQRFGVEANHFQELMVDNLKKRSFEASVSFRIEKITNRSNKRSRIASLEPEISQGKIKFCKRHQLLMDQLRQFPLAKHDDGPDALEMAIEVARSLRYTVTIGYF